MSTCQSCGGVATEQPALCDDCRTERAQHGRVKAAYRRAAFQARLDKRAERRKAG